MSNEAKKIELPKPGIYRDVPFETYLAWPAVSNSRISLARRSLLHFKEQVVAESPALTLGRFVHCGVLEPLSVAARYAVMPPFQLDAENKTGDGKPSQSKTTGYYKRKAAEFAAVNRGKEIIEQADYDVLLGINRAIFRSERAREYLGERGEAEVSLVWIDQETQLPCKARIDWLNSGINDLKTCQDAMVFAKSIANFGYHRQGAFYQTGLATIGGGEVRPFRLIAVEKTQPHGVRAAPLNDDAIETGTGEVRQALRAIADAYESNEWPGYDDPTTWCLPSWYAGGEGDVELTIGGETISL